MSVETFTNLIVILLLIPTIIYALILNNRLKNLRNSKADLGRLIEAFNDATTRAEAGIPRLKTAADGASASLKDQIKKVQQMNDDLAFMLEHAEDVLNRLDGAVKNTPKTSNNINMNARNNFQEKKVNTFNATENFSVPNSFNQKVNYNTNNNEYNNVNYQKRAMVQSDEDIISQAVKSAKDILRESENQKMNQPFVQDDFSNNSGRSNPFTIKDMDEYGDRSEAERELLKALQSMR